MPDTAWQEKEKDFIMSEEKELEETTFDENVEIIDYDIDEKIDASEFGQPLPPTPKESLDLKKELFSWIKMILCAALIAFIITEFIIINATVPTGSMETTILPGDRIMGSRLTYLFHEPERGDIIVFKYQFKKDTDYVKRIIGLPGETVQITNGEIYIYEGDTLIEGPLEEPYLSEEWTWKNDGYTFTVPNDSYFVLGDHRNNSLDTRSWYDEYYKSNLCEESDLYIKKDQILGKIYFRYWSTLDTALTDKFKLLTD